MSLFSLDLDFDFLPDVDDDEVPRDEFAFSDEAEATSEAPATPKVLE